MAIQLTLIFDGRCGFCTRAANWLVRMDRHQRIRVVPCQDDASVRALGVSQAECFQSAVAVDEGNRSTTGAPAMAAAVGHALGLPWLSRLAQLWPVSWLASGTYWVIARLRRWLPGATPLCQAHPEACGENV